VGRQQRGAGEGTALRRKGRKTPTDKKVELHPKMVKKKVPRNKQNVWKRKIYGRRGGKTKTPVENKSSRSSNQEKSAVKKTDKAGE